MSNDYENGFTPNENKAEQNQNAQNGVNSGKENAQGSYNSQPNGAYNPYGSNGAYAPNNSSNGAASNSNGDNNTTYHYAYNGSGPNNTNYYSAPAQPQQEGKAKKAKKHKKEKVVEFDANGNPIKPKKNKTAIVIAIIVAVCVIAAIIGIAVSMTSTSSDNSSKETTTSSSSSGVQIQDNAGDVATSDNEGNYTVAGIAQNCIDSCVGITVYAESSPYSYFYGYGSSNNSGSSSSDEQSVSGEGSGIIMLEDGGYTYIMTCAHVISDGSSFKVTLNNGDEYDATMVGYDNQTDIGVLKISATGLKVAEFADSDSAVVGEQVVAIGCPGGLEFMNSVTSGYISAVARPVSSSIGYDQKCIQTDAAINPGNSGGALFNMQGQVIGVNSSKIASTEYEGMGFSVPSNTAVATANSLIKVGYVEGRAQIGITYTSIENYSNATAILNALNELGFKDANGTMVINQVNSDSDLASKDVREYDMIVAVNGETLTSSDIMTSTLADAKPGDTIKLTIARIENNQIKTFDVDCVLSESKGNN